MHEGHSLAFVQPGTRIVGVDPEPKVAEPPPNATIVAQTSDDFFVDPVALDGAAIDLAFADGLHSGGADPARRRESGTPQPWTA